MEQDKVKEKIQSWILLAETLDKQNKSVFAKKFNGDIFIGEIVLIGEESITIDCFAPPQRSRERHLIYWASLIDFDILKIKEEER